MGRSGSVHCGILLIAEPSVASLSFLLNQTLTKRSNLSAWCLQLSKTKQNEKTAFL